MMMISIIVCLAILCVEFILCTKLEQYPVHDQLLIQIHHSTPNKLAITSTSPTVQTTLSPSLEPSLDSTLSPTLEPSSELTETTLFPNHTAPPTPNIIDIDTIEPTIDPTVEPTIYVNVPTIFIGSSYPTTEVTLEPSEEVTVLTLIPTHYPSEYPPSSSPLPIPTNTLSPTTLPTELPTMSSTEQESEQPTSIITQFPTSGLTTEMPTSMQPSSTSFTFIRFRSSLTLSNITSVDLDLSEQSVLTQTAAIQMIFTSTAVKFLTISVNRRNLLRSIVLFSTTTTAYIETTAIYDPIRHASPSALYANLTYALNSSVASGSFTSTMKTLSLLSNSTSKALSNAEVTAVRSSSFEVITVTDDDAPTPAEDVKHDRIHGLNPGIIAAIVLSVLALVAIGAGSLYCYSKFWTEDVEDENFDKISL